MRYTHILWDFNGTILDDVRIGVESINVLLTRHGKTPLSGVAEYRERFCFPVIDYYAAVGLEKEKFPQYAVEWVAEYNAREPETGVFDGILPLLDYFRLRDKPQYLVSATEREMLARQIVRLGLCDYFCEQVGQDDIRAHGKIEAAKAWADRVRPECALFIGDSIHDFEVASAIGAECVLIANGHQSRRRLETLGCPVYDNAAELLHALESGEIG